MTMPAVDTVIHTRRAVSEDVDVLFDIEQLCFAHDRLSKRSLRYWVKGNKGILLVVEINANIVGYGLVLCHHGARMARLYSLAIKPSERGRGLSKILLHQLETQAANIGYLFMRLEVAKLNATAIALYERCGYRAFGEYSDYYEDHGDALRMQKTIRQGQQEKTERLTPWYQQSTHFTGGPAALIMAMASLDRNVIPSQRLELNIWRQASTLFMTSGHGGCHPLGLALAAQSFGFRCRVYINKEQPLFLDSVHSQEKKQVMETVHNDFLTQANASKHLNILYQDIALPDIEDSLKRDDAILVLTSTYRYDSKKAPHWVTVTSIDERCLYVHDPDASATDQPSIDCQYAPIAREDFGKMSVIGSSRLRTAIILAKA